RDTGEETFAATISIDRSHWRHARLRVPPHWSGRRTGIGSDSYITTVGKGAHCIPVIEHKDKIGDLRTDLKPETRSTRADKGRSRPAIPSPRYDHAFAAFSAHAEPYL